MVQKVEQAFAEEHGLSAEDRFLKLYLLNQVRHSVIDGVDVVLRAVHPAVCASPAVSREPRVPAANS